MSISKRFILIFTLIILILLVALPAQAGLVPCGRSEDDPNTSGWDETDPCDFCRMMLMVQNIMNRFLQGAAGIAILLVIIGGLMYTLAGGNEEKIKTAKSVLTSTIIGFVIVACSWLIVEVTLTAFGFVHPLAGGQWFIICPSL